MIRTGEVRSSTVADAPPASREHDLHAPRGCRHGSRRPLGQPLRQDRRRHEPRRRSRIGPLHLKRTPPAEQKRARDPVSPCRRRDKARRPQALKNDLELLVLRQRRRRPASTTSSRPN